MTQVSSPMYNDSYNKLITRIRLLELLLEKENQDTKNSILSNTIVNNIDSTQVVIVKRGIEDDETRKSVHTKPCKGS